MRVLMILCTALILSACASNDRVPLPHWGEARQDFGQVHDATDLPVLCPMDISTLAWSAECWAVLADYDDIAQDNVEIANLQASALRKVIGAYDHTISAGELQQQVSEMYRELLDQERTEHFWTKTTYRVIFGIGIIAVAL